MVLGHGQAVKAPIWAVKDLDLGWKHNAGATPLGLEGVLTVKISYRILMRACYYREC